MAANAERKDFAAAQHAPEEVSRRKVKDDERGASSLSRRQRLFRPSVPFAC